MIIFKFITFNIITSIVYEAPLKYCKRFDRVVTDRSNEKSLIDFVKLRNNADAQQFSDTGQSIQKLFAARV